MRPTQYLYQFVTAISKRTGISRHTLEVVVPAVFDEIREQMCEDGPKCVPIESFGTFVVIDVPEREYLYNRKGVKELRKLSPMRRMKFRPTIHMKKEIEQGKFDPTRHAFEHHPEDGKLRKRAELKYRADRRNNHLQDRFKRIFDEDDE